MDGWQAVEIALLAQKKTLLDKEGMVSNYANDSTTAKTFDCAIDVPTFYSPFETPQSVLEVPSSLQNMFRKSAQVVQEYERKGKF